MLSCWTGERSAAHRESRRRHGITREAVWIQTTSAGDIAVVLIESPDIAAALLGHPVRSWMRSAVELGNPIQRIRRKGEWRSWHWQTAKRSADSRLTTSRPPASSTAPRWDCGCPTYRAIAG